MAGSERPLRVALVEDHRLIWDSLVKPVEELGHAVVAVARAVGELPEVADLDVVVCDLSLPAGPTGAAAIGALTRAGRRVLAVSGVARSETVLDAIEAGAGGFVEKSADPATFAAAVVAVAVDGCQISALLAGYLLADLRRRPLARDELSVEHRSVLEALAQGDTLAEICGNQRRTRAEVVALTMTVLEVGRRRRRRYRPSPRERQVMILLVCHGLSRQDIADRLHITPWTVTSVLESIRDKYRRLHPEHTHALRPSVAAQLWAAEIELCEST